MVFSLRFDWRGTLDVERFHKAWRSVVEANVRIHSTLLGRGRHQSWRVDPIDMSRFLIVRHEPFEIENAFVADQQPDVRRGVGVNILIWINPERTIMQFQFHHA